jgi:hypothetical protein
MPANADIFSPYRPPLIQGRAGFLLPQASWRSSARNTLQAQDDRRRDSLAKADQSSRWPGDSLEKP